MHLCPPTTKTEAECLMGFIIFWRQHILHFIVLLQSIYRGTWQASVWSPEQKDALQQIQAECKLLCHLVGMIQQSQWWLKYQRQVKKLNSVSGARTVTDKFISYLIENHTNLKLDKVYCRKLQIKTTLTILTSLFIIKILTLWSVGKEMSYIADENVNCYSL